MKIISIHTKLLCCISIHGGYTGFEDGTKVDSVENRVVLFDGSTPLEATCESEGENVLSISYF